MKTTGMIFTGNHPRLILDGTKTQTRRVIKPDTLQYFYNEPVSEDDRLRYCPYGQVGDRLRVRETHYRWGHWAKNGFSKSGKQKWTFRAESNEVYYLDNPPCAVQRNSFRGTAWYKRPSLFMPNSASRSMLEILEIRAERVQDIGEEDCYKEGLNLSIGMMLVEPHWMTKDILRRKYKDLWDSLNAKRGYGWDFNPWVWVILFKMLGDKC